MTGASIAQTVDRLAELLQSNALPARARPTAERLIQRLTSPVRIAIAGDAGVGKTALCQLFATTQSEAGFTPNGTFVDTQTDATSQGWARAAAQSDMLIWVVPDGSDRALRSWHARPAKVPDHAFLVLNLRAGEPTPNPEALAALHRHGFAAAFSLNVAQEQARRDHAAGVGLDPMDRSDLDRLFSALHAYVDAGCQADIDGALLFLQRFASKRHQAGPRPAAPPARDIELGQSLPHHQQPAQDRDLAASAPDPVPQPAWPTPSPAAERTPGPTREPAPPDGVGDTLRQVLLDRVMPLRQMDLSASGSQERLIRHHLETLEALADSDALPRALDGPVQQAQDLILLLQLENTEASAIQATLAMLQIKRHLTHADTA